MGYWFWPKASQKYFTFEPPEAISVSLNVLKSPQTTSAKVRSQLLLIIISVRPPRDNCVNSCPARRTSFQPAFSLATSTCTSSQTTQTCPTLLKIPLPNLRILLHPHGRNTSRRAPYPKSTTSIITHIFTTIVEKKSPRMYTLASQL